MREMEFLPTWYPQLRQRKRLVLLQVYMSMVLLAGLGLWMVMFNRNVAADRARLAQLNHELEDTQIVLQKLDELEKLDAQLKKQEDVIEKIGLHVEVTRMINVLEKAMSNDMSLLNLSIEVFEQQRTAKLSLAALSGQGGPGDQQPAMDRTLKVKVQGVAPTDVELANFLAKLSHNTLFGKATLNYTKESTRNGHVMREFEVNFNVDLNTRG